MQNIDINEVNKFNDLAKTWWDPKGPFKALHAINPLRLEFISSQVNVNQLEILDLGCGGGILAEAMAEQGAKVRGIDLSPEVLKVAQEHQLKSNLKINYQFISSSQLSQQNPQSFDVITCMEMLEHVPNPEQIVEDSAKLIKTGGKIFFSTISRNLKAYLFAIIGAEYCLKLLPKGTHDYAKFISPHELDHWARLNHLKLLKLSGISYNPLTQKYALTHDLKVNYLACYEKV